MCHSDTETQTNKHTLRSHLFIAEWKEKGARAKARVLMCERLFIPKGGQRSKVKHLQEKKDLSVARGGMAKKTNLRGKELVSNWSVA